VRAAANPLRLAGHLGDPTRDQLLAMAYVDGELAEDARQRFEERLRGDQALVQEVAALEAFFDLVARKAASP
jgi:anti-sigma factor RsiW